MSTPVYYKIRRDDSKSLTGKYDYRKDPSAAHAEEKRIRKESALRYQRMQAEAEAERALRYAYTRMAVANAGSMSTRSWEATRARMSAQARWDDWLRRAEGSVQGSWRARTGGPYLLDEPPPAPAPPDYITPPPLIGGYSISSLIASGVVPPPSSARSVPNSSRPSSASRVRPSSARPPSARPTSARPAGLLLHSSPAASAYAAIGPSAGSVGPASPPSRLLAPASPPGGPRQRPSSAQVRRPEPSAVFSSLLVTSPAEVARRPASAPARRPPGAGAPLPAYPTGAVVVGDEARTLVVHTPVPAGPEGAGLALETVGEEAGYSAAMAELGVRDEPGDGLDEPPAPAAGPSPAAEAARWPEPPPAEAAAVEPPLAEAAAVEPPLAEAPSTPVPAIVASPPPPDA